MSEILETIAWASLPHGTLIRKLAALCRQKVITKTLSESRLLNWLRDVYDPDRGTETDFVLELLKEIHRQNEIRSSRNPHFDRRSRRRGEVPIEAQLRAHSRQLRNTLLVKAAHRYFKIDYPDDPPEEYSPSYTHDCACFGRIGDFLIVVGYPAGEDGPPDQPERPASLKVIIENVETRTRKSFTVNWLTRPESLSEFIFWLAPRDVRRSMMTGQRVKFLPESLMFQVNDAAPVSVGQFLRIESN